MNVKGYSLIPADLQPAFDKLYQALDGLEVYQGKAD